MSVRNNLAQFVAGLERQQRDLLDKAIPRALNRTADMAATATGRDIRQQGYGFKAAQIKDAIRVSKANRSKLTATLYVGRKPKSLIAFNAVQTKEGVRVKVRGAAKVIKHAFIGQLRNGRLGVYVEDKTAGKIILRHAKSYKGGGHGGWQDYPVRKLYGPSVGGVYGTERVQAVARGYIARTFVERLQHEINYLSR